MPAGRRGLRGRRQLDRYLTAQALLLQLLPDGDEGMPPEQHLRGTIRDYYEHAMRRQPLRKIREKLGCRGIRPMKIVHEQDEGLNARNLLEELCQFALHPLARSR